jgi:pimeloyl-ACP methyl ester carboxylesterase
MKLLVAIVLLLTTLAPAAAGEIVRAASKDGTQIGMECEGRGPTLLFVHGGIGDRTRWTPMIPLLSAEFTVCAMDRRGRGVSGNAAEYSLQKEAEDVAALVDSREGEVYVLGHSYGGVAALEAALLTKRISKLMLYEVPLHDPVDRNLAAARKVEKLIARGDREGATVTFLTEIGNQTPQELAAMKTRPTWPGLVDTIVLHPRQMRELAAYRFDAERVKKVDVPTLLLIGSDTPSPYLRQSIEALQTTLPKPTLVVLQGQQHNAMDGGRDLLANAIRRFLLE